MLKFCLFWLICLVFFLFKFKASCSWGKKYPLLNGSFFCLAGEVALGSLIKYFLKSIFNYFAPSLKTCPNQRILKFKFMPIFRLSSMFRQNKLYFFILTHYVLKYKSFAVELEVRTEYCALHVYLENAQYSDWCYLDVREGDSEFVLSGFETLVGFCFPFFHSYGNFSNIHWSSPSYWLLNWIHILKVESKLCMLWWLICSIMSYCIKWDKSYWIKDSITGTVLLIFMCNIQVTKRQYL